MLSSFEGVAAANLAAAEVEPTLPVRGQVLQLKSASLESRKSAGVGGSRTPIVAVYACAVVLAG